LEGGDAPAAQSFSATSSTGQALPFSARADGGSWLSVQPASGSTPARIQVAVDQTGLQPGIYSANVVVSSPGITDLLVPVTLAVDTAPALLDVSPTFARLAAPQGSTNILQQALFIRNAGGGGSINFQASVGAGGEWLTVAPAQGQTTPNSPIVV